MAQTSTRKEQRILVVYASKYGSTAEIASRIANVIKQSGAQVDCVNAKDSLKKSLDQYQMIIIGSAIRIGRWLPEARAFVEQNSGTLSTIPVAVFSVHTNNTDDSTQARTNRAMYHNDVKKVISPVSEAFFNGVTDPSKMNFMEKMMVKMVKAPAGDFREWDKIEQWAKENV